MDLLLETRLLRWISTDPERVSLEAWALIGAPGATIWASAASYWFDLVRFTRIDLQRSGGNRGRGARLRRERIDPPIADLRRLEVTQRHAAAIGDLPHLHADPHERLLIAQARVEGFTLLTTSQTVAGYGAGVRLV